MFRNILWVVALLLLETIAIDGISVGSIRNVSLSFSNSSSLLINATCAACLCRLYSSRNFASFNCYANNQSCRMHQKSDQNKSFLLMPSSITKFYFLSLPNVQSTSDMIGKISLLLSSSARRENDSLMLVDYLWTFDSSFNDQSSTMNFSSINGAGYSTSTITGYGASLSLNASQSQYLWMSEPFLNLLNTSWTFELWIYPQTIPSVSDSPLIVQCQLPSMDQCLHLIIRYQKVFFGFYSDDTSGVERLVPLRWYHLAFVFDCSTRNQSIYIDGFLDSSHQASVCFQGDPENLTVGFSHLQARSPSYWYDGLIDQLSYTNRSKTADEILRDATLTAYFSFDDSSTADAGPLGISGSRSGSTSFSAGRVGDALQINDVLDSYFRLSGLVLLGRRNQSYSLAIWIRPSVLKNSMIIHVSTGSAGFGWCVPMLTLTSSGYLRTMSWSGVAVTIDGPPTSVNQWTHAAITYSINNGLRLYVNGTLRNSSLPFFYAASGSANYLFLGSSLAGTSYCTAIASYDGQYAGLVDELRVYSRELGSVEVLYLASQ